MSVDLEMEEILNLFFEESFEGLDTMESGLLTLESGADPEAINTIFRAAHSIKGGAGTFGLTEISEFTHSVETLLDEMRNKTRAVTPEVIQVLLQAVDVMRGMTQSAQAKQPIVMTGANALSGELKRILAQKAPAAAVAAVNTAASAVTSAAAAVNGAAAAVKGAAAAVNTALPLAGASDGVPTGHGPLVGWRIVFAPDASIFKTCNDPMRIFTELGKLGPLEVSANAAKVPALGTLDPTQCYLSWTLLLHAAIEQPRIAEVFDWVNASSKIDYEPIYGKAAPSSVAANPDAEGPPAASPPEAVTAHLSPAAAQPEAGPAQLPPTASHPEPVTADPQPAAANTPKSTGDSGSLRVATEKVDALINLVGELVITQSMLGRFAEKYEPGDIEALRRNLTQLTRNTRELQESVMQIRMLPIGFSFNRFPRLVHDMSRKLGKKVILKLTGENTELDKTVLEKIGDPLVHLVRNSLDHGLETPAERLAAGKGETGTLELNAYHEGGSVIIEVKDDGAGLNTERILAKARQKNLVAEGAVLSEEQINNLIFTPGFSTSDTVSDISGRGVGMDVVRRNIHDLGGHVQLLSVKGKGSTVRIRLPLTLAILEGQVLRVGKEIYVTSLVSIIETVEVKREQLSVVAGRTELYKHRTEYLPIMRLHELFGIEPDSRDIADGLLIVLEADGLRVAMLVDELLAQQQVVIKSLETNFKHVSGLAGATIHGDGTVALILDVPGLIRTFFNRETAQLGLAA
jgi:two-component system chemotaxis sensor kinase CheA